jgi:hypothetical protein
MSRAGVVFTSLFIVFVVVGCGGSQVTVQGQNRAAGADGTINVDPQETGNFVIETVVEHLLPPGRFGEGITTYAVWFQAPDEQPERVGILDYDEGDRRGEMMATTSLSAFEVIVTGETAADAVAPSEYIVFRTSVNAN